MASDCAPLTLEAVRAIFAARLLPPAGLPRLGAVDLAPHQQAAVRRIATLLAGHGGALLADDVGLGKTFVALALARAYANPLVIAPAGLHEMWRAAMSRADVATALGSYEALSRGDRDGPRPDLVILDEAHHARSRAAKRHRRIATLTAHAHTLLLTATPVANRVAELRNILALFLGARAHSVAEAELGDFIVRRTAAAVPAAVLPTLREPAWIEVLDDSACLHALERLPPAVPAADGGDGGALLLVGLVRQWSSSRAALVSALRRRLAVAAALESSLAEGRMPVASELEAWTVAGGAMQLALPGIVAARASPTVNPGALAAAVRLHRDGVSAALAQARTGADPDIVRAGRIIDLRRLHAGERILCFTSYAQTAEAYWRLLRHHQRVARLTARGGCIASGPLTRGEVLRRFAPSGQLHTPPAPIEEITLLIATDLLAEGVDLRDATVVVHLDLPWSPARMEQRVGRVRRLGSAAESIAVYAMRPPAEAETMLALEARLRAKIADAGRSVGSTGLVLPVAFGVDATTGARERPPSSRVPRSDTERMSLLVDRIAAWRPDGAGDASPDLDDAAGPAPVAAVLAPEPGWLALVRMGHMRRLIARVGGLVASDVSHLERALDLAEGSPGSCSRAVMLTACREAAGSAAEWAAEQCLEAAPVAGIRRRVLDRIHASHDRAAPHRRARAASLAGAARALATGRLSRGMESMLAALCDTVADDEAWLAAVAALPVAARGTDRDLARVQALIVFDCRQCASPATLTAPAPAMPN